ncbi:hypothetical protein NG726_27970 [Pseudomonas sp. MOB-449]|nr:hypothetical protein [Pseudomonas sp. MOB-449]
MLLALVGSGGVLLRPFVEPRVAAVLAAGGLLLWLAALLLRTLYYRFNRHNASLYAHEVAEVERAWWSRHRQEACLQGAVLLGAVGTTQEHWRLLLARQHRTPVPHPEGNGTAIRLLSVFAKTQEERETQLAQLLAMQWREQLPASLACSPVACYWQGSASAWKAFTDDMTRHCPGLKLPEHPEPWQGQRSLELAIERLQRFPQPAHMLCAGCGSVPTGSEGKPAGEAAVLWLLARSGTGVRLGRGEWYSERAERLVDVAVRAQVQSGLEGPPEACVSFAQPEVAELPDIGWRLDGQLQDANWGALGELEMMVVQTLAASYAEQHRKPCGWLAKDPAHRLVLGVVKIDEP